MNVIKWVSGPFIILIMESLMELHGKYHHLTKLSKANKDSMEVKLVRDSTPNFRFIDHKAMVLKVFMMTLPLYGKNNLNLVQEDKIIKVFINQVLNLMVKQHTIHWNHLILIKHLPITSIKLYHQMTIDLMRMLKLKLLNKERNNEILKEDWINLFIKLLQWMMKQEVEQQWIVKIHWHQVMLIDILIKTIIVLWSEMVMLTNHLELLTDQNVTPLQLRIQNINEIFWAKLKKLKTFRKKPNK